MEARNNERLDLLRAAGDALMEMVNGTLTIVKDGTMPESKEEMIASATAMVVALNLIHAEIVREGVYWMHGLADGLCDTREEQVVSYQKVKYVSEKTLLDWAEKKFGGDEG